jgi:hypothetical protein
MGLSVIAGTDGGGSIGDEIVNLAGIGMTPMEAIRAALTPRRRGLSRQGGRPQAEAAGLKSARATIPRTCQM